MSTQLVALPIREDGSLSPHAGRALYWQVFSVDAGYPPQRVWDLKLKEPGCLHEWHVRGDGNRHPLHSVDVVLAGSAGDGVIRNLALRETTLIATAETDPEKALADFVAGTLVAPLPHEEAECLRTKAP